MAVPVILFAAAGALTLTTRPYDSVGLRQPGTTHRGSWVTPTAVTACTMAGVVLVAALVTSTAEGAGPGPGVAPAVPLSAESLTSNLLAVEVHDANDVLFQANSQYRTYWQVAVLNVLRNGVWVPDPDTQNTAHGATGGAPVTQSQAGGRASAGSRDFTSAVQIDDLSSRILPVPPGTIALSGTAARLTGVGAVSNTPTTPGLHYTTLSTPPVTEPESLGGNAPVTTYPPALAQADTALPALPPGIEALAHAVTTGAQGPLAQAELLVNWFRSGQFRYTLNPPPSPVGTDPLVSFLTQTPRAAASNSRARSWCWPDRSASPAGSSWASRRAATAVPARSPSGARTPMRGPRCIWGHGPAGCPSSPPHNSPEVRLPPKASSDPAA